eukprot:6209173-Pleurochrysis_carterae.AAC.3
MDAYKNKQSHTAHPLLQPAANCPTTSGSASNTPLTFEHLSLCRVHSAHAVQRDEHEAVDARSAAPSALYVWLCVCLALAHVDAEVGRRMPVIHPRVAPLELARVLPACPLIERHANRQGRRAAIRAAPARLARSCTLLPDQVVWTTRLRA